MTVLTPDLLRRARDHLREHGWRRGQYEDKDGRCCVGGAVQRVHRWHGHGTGAGWDRDLENELDALVHGGEWGANIEEANDDLTGQEAAEALVDNLALELEHKQQPGG